MRRSPPVLATLALLALAAACAGPSATGPAPAAPAAASKAAEPSPAKPLAATAPAEATATVSIPVSGMHCGNCSRRVTAALTAIDGVVSAETLLAEKRAVVTYAPARVTPAAMVAAIRDAGYQPGEPVPQ